MSYSFIPGPGGEPQKPDDDVTQVPDIVNDPRAKTDPKAEK